MRALRRIAIVFASSLIIAKLVDVFLISDFGKRIIRRSGFESLLTEEGTETARRYSKMAAGLLVGTFLTLRARRHGKQVVETGLVKTAENAAEVVMAAGALAKIVSDFLREEEEIRKVRANF